jgi:cell wall-associated NlpC family hydrolase
MTQLAASRGALAAALLATGLVAGCASGGAVPQPVPGAGGRTAPSSPAPPVPAGTVVPGTGSVEGMALTSTALSLRGAPYRNGGTTPGGFDCSGFVQYVFGQHGLAMPRETREQFRVGRRVSRNDLEAGDLVFFTTIAPGASHVGIVIGDDQFVHAPSSNGVVRVERLSSSYWNRRFVGARRPR